MSRMAPLSRPESLNESHEMTNCDTPNEDVKHDGVSPVVRSRRVIFPSLYSKKTEGECSSIQEETPSQHSSTTAQSPLTREDSELLGASFQFRSPVLPDHPHGARRCAELGLDMPSVRISSPKSTVGSEKGATKTFGNTAEIPPFKRSQNDKDTSLLNGISTSFPKSPGLSPRMCDELGIDIPSMSLDNDTGSSPKPLLVPRSSKSINSKHFANKTPTRASINSGSKPSPQRRSRIDSSYKNYVTSSQSTSLNEKLRAPSRQSSSCSTAAKTPRRPSILRHGKWSITSSSSSDEATPLDKKNSVPSLVPLGECSNSSCETLHSEQSDPTELPSTPRKTVPRSVSFDARVWVLEYKRSQQEMDNTWFTAEELEHFRKQTIARLVAHNTELLPSGTGFVVQRGSLSTKAVFALPSMSSIAEDDSDDVDESDVVNAVNDEIQNVLVVDPHDLCAKLFTRDLKSMIPQVNVCTASSSEEARKRIKDKERFDVVIVEERLKLFHRHHFVDQWRTRISPPESDHVSGSEFIHELAQERKEYPLEENCLFIAVTAHLDKDKERMQANGADFIWAKPPPKLDEIVRDVLLKALLIKRGKKELADHLFGDFMGAP